jgi:hypothetical protein
MMWVRRCRWMAIAVLAATLSTVFLITAEGWADHSVARCATVISARQGRGDQAWRTGAFQVAGCRAWRHLHRHPAHHRISR